MSVRLDAARLDAARLERHHPAYARTTLALFAAGFSTFALMYCFQPLLPELAKAFHVSATASSLAVSLTTGALSVTLLLSGAVSERIPRKQLIVASLGATAALTILGVSAPDWTTFLVLRALAGVAFAGLPAIMMAYIGEEIAETAAGLAMGLYVAGTAVGGMSGRLVAAALTDYLGWRVAIAASGVLGLVVTIAVAMLLPPARQSARAELDSAGLFAVFRAHLAQPALRLLFAQGFLYMGVFVAVYNYLTFRLVAAPYLLGHTAIGSIFLVYLVGMVSSPWAGAVAARRGRRRTLSFSLISMLIGTALTLLSPLTAVIGGLALLTFGFFAAHAVTSTWIGVLAGTRKAQASSLYIVCYYVGASVTGTLAGLFWTRAGWTGVALFVLAQTIVALGLLGRLTPDAD